MENQFQLDHIIRRALEEDLGTGDITTEAVIEPSLKGKASILAKQDLVLAGSAVFKQVFEILDAAIQCRFHYQEGGTVKDRSIIGELSGAVDVILKGERTALNFMQRMSGIATQTRQYVDKVKKYGTKILDTRKTVPGLRILDKYAVRIGGGHNHRLSLADGVLIKDNHIAAAGSIREAVALAQKKVPHTLKIEVEVQTLDQIEEAISAGADIILLDNMSPDQMTQAVKQVNKRVLLEASGSVNLNTVEAIAATGVDFISIGALTHSVRAVDISLDLINFPLTKAPGMV